MKPKNLKRLLFLASHEWNFPSKTPASGLITALGSIRGFLKLFLMTSEANGLRSMTFDSNHDSRISWQSILYESDFDENLLSFQFSECVIFSLIRS